MAQMSTAEIIEMYNEAIKDVGFAEGMTVETYEQVLQQMSTLTAQQINLIIHNMYLVAEQRQFTNIWTREKNPLKDFLFDMKKVGGWTIQDYMLNLLDGITPYWDDSYSDSQVVEGLVKDYEQKISTKYHMKPFSKQFATTIDEKDYGKYFYPYAFDRFVNSKIANLGNSAEVWLLKSVLIDIIKEMVTNNDIVTNANHNPNNDVGVKHMLESIKTVYSGVNQPTALYNKDGVVSITPDDIPVYLITKPSMLERIKTYTYSGAYNLGELILPDRVILVPEDTNLGTMNGQNVLAVALDKRALVVGLRTWRVTDFFVSNELKRNYFLSVEGVRGYNTFINAVAFTGEALGNFQ